MDFHGRFPCTSLNLKSIKAITEKDCFVQKCNAYITFEGCSENISFVRYKILEFQFKIKITGSF